MMFVKTFLDNYAQSKMYNVRKRPNDISQLTNYQGYPSLLLYMTYSSNHIRTQNFDFVTKTAASKNECTLYNKKIYIKTYYLVLWLFVMTLK